jgi:putative transposase
MSELLLPDTVYHIYTHANGNENLFRCEENYRYFLAKYAERIYAVVDTYAYCLMPNHLHLMVRVRSEEEIATLSGFRTLTESQKYVSQQFSHLFNGYTQAYNKMYDRRGSLFERPFKRKIVSDENYFTQLIAYIHNNPVHHGFCKNLIDWPYSSFHAYLVDKPTKLNKKYLDEWFGNREALLEFHQKWLSSGNQFELV